VSEVGCTKLIALVKVISNAAENAFADRAILLDENLLLFEQNNEKATRKSIKATVVASARVMSYEDIVEAQKQRDVKEAAAEVTRSRRSKRNPAAQVLGKRSRGKELEKAEQEIRTLRMEEYSKVRNRLQFRTLNDSILTPTLVL
jgi:hypothetical protein